MRAASVSRARRSVPVRVVGYRFPESLSCVDGAQVPYFDQSVWAGIATLNGLPATTAPLGHSDDGLPIGVQIVGGYLEDYTTIGFAGLIEIYMRHAYLSGSTRQGYPVRNLSSEPN